MPPLSPPRPFVPAAALWLNPSCAAAVIQQAGVLRSPPAPLQSRFLGIAEREQTAASGMSTQARSIPAWLWGRGNVHVNPALAAQNCGVHPTAGLRRRAPASENKRSFKTPC